MVHLVGVSTVFVPFEKRGQEWVKRDDLPRFRTSKECMDYLVSNNDKISWRRHKFGGRSSYVQLEWREHSEPDLIKEYIDGVGTPEFNLKRKRR